MEGFCPVAALELSPVQQEKLDTLCPGAQTVFVSLFPYFAGLREGNLSLYARGRDYHAVAGEALEKKAETLRERFPGRRFRVLVDASPVPEVRAAVLAGLGVQGDNGLLIHPVYGSYVFIGTIVSDLAVEGADSAAARECLHCGACRAACPVGAIGDGGVDASRCLSALTQRGGAVSEEEAAALRAHPLIWGCDFCQTVCPMNRAAQKCCDPAFREDLLDFLTLSDLEGLSRKAFLKKYPDRAFTWRGPGPLRRNLELKEENRPETERHQR